MKSIDKLRKYVTGGAGQGISIICEKNILKNLDNIEREGIEERTAAYNKGHDEGFDLGFVSADDWFANHEDAMAEHGWVRLPVDADGEPWHINDEFEVDEGIAHVNGIGDNRLYYIDNDGMQWTRADNKLHHHAPTVEDVLREFVDEFNRDDTELSDGEIIERFAAKLRLAGDD